MCKSALKMENMMSLIKCLIFSFSPQTNLYSTEIESKNQGIGSIFKMSLSLSKPELYLNQGFHTKLVFFSFSHCLSLYILKRKAIKTSLKSISMLSNPQTEGLCYTLNLSCCSSFLF